MKRRVLFICNHNAGRSQMAEGLLRERYGDYYEASSAGLNPSPAINLNTVAVMAEAGIDISQLRPKPVAGLMDGSFDMLVVMCDCSSPVLPQADKVIRQTFSDPYLFSGSDEEIRAGFRRVRDEIGVWIDTVFGEGRGDETE